MSSSLEEYVASHPGVAVAAATIAAGGVERQFYNCDPGTRFELGSITKVFTGVLLCEAVEDGLCSFDTRLAEVLPEWTPPLLGRRITLGQLATHTSGLPRLPLEMYLRRSMPQPYERWDRNRILTALAKTIVVRTPGSVHHYSNFGFAVLGVVLEELRGRSYQELVEDLTDRLGCPEVRLPRESDSTFQAVGHDMQGSEVETWRMCGFAPAGGLTSTLEGLVSFAQKCLAPLDAQGLADSMVVRRKAPKATRSPLRATLQLFSTVAATAVAYLQPDTMFLTPVAICAAAYEGGPWAGMLPTLLWGYLADREHMHGNVVFFRIGVGFVGMGIAQELRKNRVAQTMGVGWHILTSDPEKEVIWHNGGMAGARTFLGLLPSQGSASIVLAASAQSVDSIGLSRLTG